jgi:hypothetical protein
MAWWSSPRRVVAIAATVLAVGCGLGLEGAAVSDTTAPPGAAPPARDAGAEDVAVDPGDAGDAATIDVDAGCQPTVSADPLSTLDVNRWLAVSNPENAGYPQVTTLGGAAAGTWVEIVHDVDFAKGGIWWRQKLATHAFDVSFGVYTQCGSRCGDGVAFAWIDTSSTSALANGDNGSVIGMPKLVAGGAAQLDLFENQELGDGPAPSMRVLALDATKFPGTYKWVVKSSAKNDALQATPHTIGLRLRAGVVHVSVDGSEVTSGAVSSGFAGYVGFTAANGGFNGRIFVRDFSAKTYDCDPPQ